MRGAVKRSLDVGAAAGKNKGRERTVQLPFGNDLIKYVLGHGLYGVGIHDKLVVFAAGGGVVLIRADLVYVRGKILQIQYAQTAERTHAVLKGVLFVFVRYDAQITFVREFRKGLLVHSAIFAQKRTNTEISALNIIFLQINQNRFPRKIHDVPPEKSFGKWMHSTANKQKYEEKREKACREISVPQAKTRMPLWLHQKMMNGC